MMYIRSVMASTDTADLSQPTEMLFAGLALIMSGMLAMPAVLDRVPQKAYRILMGSVWSEPLTSSWRHQQRP